MTNSLQSCVLEEIKKLENLKFVCDESYLEEVIRFAETTQQTESLMNCFKRLNIAHQKQVKIFKDFAPYSFEFVGDLYGGIIYHGPHDKYGSGGEPTFSVSLTKSQGWSIHT